MEAPGCWQALTNSALNSGVYVLCVRRVGYVKVRYRGLKKNTLQIVTLFALGNLWMARHKLLAMGKMRVQRA